MKSERLERLQALRLRQQQAFNESRIGMEFDILLEKPGRLEGQLIGRSPWPQSVNVTGTPGEIGSLVCVRIHGTGANSLFGERI